MNPHDFFLQLMIVLLGARVFGEVAARLKWPSVIGEILVGVVLGPSMLGYLKPDATIQLLAAIGVILLLFEVGLESDMTRLAKAGLKSTLVAFVGVTAPFLLGYAVSRWGFGLGSLASMFIGGTLTATSIGITVRVLEDLNRHRSPESQIVLGAAVIDDILGVVILAVLFDFTRSGTVSFLNTLEVVGFIALFLLLSPVAAKIFGRLVKRLDATGRVPGIIPTTIVSILLFFAWTAHEIGAPELLGGFAAGLALSRQFFLPLGAMLHADPVFAHRVEDQMKPVVALFKPIFFVMVGLSLDLKAIDVTSGSFWMLLAALTFTGIVGKMLSGAVLVKERPLARAAVGLAMVPRGEVGLIFAEVGRESGALDAGAHAALVAVIALTTLLPPFLMRQFYARYGDRLDAPPPG